uniref:Secreted protein n=1 Tax=Anopheles darlingi TaxID=43151 RepID=A0A2M4DPT0_ANODA
MKLVVADSSELTLTPLVLLLLLLLPPAAMVSGNIFRNCDVGRNRRSRRCILGVPTIPPALVLLPLLLPPAPTPVALSFIRLPAPELPP